MQGNFWFLHTRVRERVRGAHHSASGFNSKYKGFGHESFSAEKVRDPASRRRASAFESLSRYSDETPILDIYNDIKNCRYGERGIRTLGALRHTDFPGLPIKPLSHLSRGYSDKFYFTRLENFCQTTRSGEAMKIEE